MRVGFIYRCGNSESKHNLVLNCCVSSCSLRGCHAHNVICQVLNCCVIYNLILLTISLEKSQQSEPLAPEMLFSSHGCWYCVVSACDLNDKVIKQVQMSRISYLSTLAVYGRYVQGLMLSYVKSVAQIDKCTYAH